MCERVCEVVGVEVNDVCCKLCPKIDSPPRKAYIRASETKSKCIDLCKFTVENVSLSPVGLSIWFVIATGVVALIAVVFFITTKT